VYVSSIQIAGFLVDEEFGRMIKCMQDGEKANILKVSDF